MRFIVCALIVLGFCATGASAARVGCAVQSGKNFGDTLKGRDFLHFGPLTFFPSFRDATGATKDVLEMTDGFWKSPAILRAGRRATVSVTRRSRDVARLYYGGKRDHTIRFRSCLARNAASLASGRPVTFWSGGLILKRTPACVHLVVRIPDQAIRRWRIPVGPSGCSN